MPPPGARRRAQPAPRRERAPALPGLVALAILAAAILTTPRLQGSSAAGQQDGAAQPDPIVTGAHSEATTPSEEAPAPKVAALVLTTDAPATILVGGVALGLLEAGQSLEADLESLTVQISATAAGLPHARWFEDLVLEPDEIRTIAIPMLETIETARKKERREHVFRDIDNGWMWTRRDNARDLAWAGAAAYCEALDLGGFDNWRLPSIDELETLEAMWSLKALKVADQVVLSSCCLWSSTEGEDRGAWNLDFRFRRPFEINRTLSFGLRALCMREMEPDELAESRLAADPKERKRRLKEKRQRLDERRRRKAERARQSEDPS